MQKAYQLISPSKAGGRAVLAFCRNTTVESSCAASRISSPSSRVSGCSLVKKLGVKSSLWDMACSGSRATSSSCSPSVVANENLRTQQVQAGRTAGERHDRDCRWMHAR